MMKKTEKLKKYIYYFFSFAFMGWIWEELENIMLHQRLINCGTLIGPWLPIYGWTMLIIILLSKKIKNKPLLFLVIFLLCGIIEYSTSYFLEYFYHTRWWDYTNYPLNINGRTSIEVLMVFSSLALLSKKYVVPFLDKIYEKINPKFLTIALSIILLLHLMDFIYCINHPHKPEGIPISNLVSK